MKSTLFLALALMLSVLLVGCASQPEVAVDTGSYADGYQDGFAAGRAAALEELASQALTPAATPTPSQTSTQKPTKTPIDLTQIAIDHWKGVTVYITDAREEYHRGDCESLRDSRIAITLYDVIEHEYKPCELCNPPLPYEPYP